MFVLNPAAREILAPKSAMVCITYILQTKCRLSTTSTIVSTKPSKSNYSRQFTVRYLIEIASELLQFLLQITHWGQPPLS